MKILAIDLSTRRGSLALLDGEQVLARAEWTEAARGGRVFFSHLEALQQEAGVAWDELDGFAVGRGPGTFSGMRISLITAQSLALPSKTPVHTITSGEVMAHDLAQKTSGRQHIAVLGDARRDRVWFRSYRRSETGLEGLDDWALLPMEEAMAALPEDTVLATPDLDTLQAPLRALLREDTVLYEEPVQPCAEILARRVRDRIAAGVPSEPLTPLYLHPPVFVAPRFSNP